MIRTHLRNATHQTRAATESNNEKPRLKRTPSAELRKPTVKRVLQNTIHQDVTARNREMLTGKRKQQQTEGRKPPYIEDSFSNDGYKIMEGGRGELCLSYFGIQYDFSFFPKRNWDRKFQIQWLKLNRTITIWKQNCITERARWPYEYIIINGKREYGDRMPDSLMSCA